MGVDPETPERPEWFAPGRYSIWASEQDNGDEPILIAAYEWEEAGLRAIRVDCVWLYEGEDRRWDEHPDYEVLGAGVEAVLFARLIASGRVQRIGVMPAIGRYSAPPTWLDGETRHAVGCESSSSLSKND